VKRFDTRKSSGVLPMLMLSVLTCAATVSAQQSEIRNPHTSPEDVAAGGRLFHSHCAVCHGLDGSGPRGAGADLTKGQFRRGDSDAALRETIRDGIPGTEMPAIFFEGKQLWQIVAYVRTLSSGPGAPSGTGDAGRGKALFSKGGCSQCHKINDTGNRLGPNLSDIGARRSAKYLRTAVLRPNDTVLPQHRILKVVTKRGDQIAGTRLNEDSYSFQIRDGNGRLVSLLKSDVKEYELVKTSSMPAYEERLSAAEVDDLVAYLSTLRRGAPR
jgi:putative heme-binding domain-containing protein